MQPTFTFHIGQNRYQFEPYALRKQYKDDGYIRGIQNGIRPVIMNTYQETNTYDFNELKRITNELKQIKSNYFVELIETGTYGSTMTVIYEYNDMGTYDQFIKNTSLSWRLKILIDILQALKCLHENGMIAGELQPSRIFITSMDTTDKVNCKLSVYGRNKPICLEKMKLSEVFRNIVYKAPEVLSTLFSSKKSDVFSYGILMYETFAQTLPYISKDGEVLMNHFLRITKEVSFNHHPQISKRMWNVILSCCEFEAIERVEIQEIEEHLIKEMNETEHYGESFGKEYHSSPLSIETILSQYKNQLSEWTEKDSVSIYYRSTTTVLTQDIFKQKIFDTDPIMIIIQSNEGHIFGCYYGGCIK